MLPSIQNEGYLNVSSKHTKTVRHTHNQTHAFSLFSRSIYLSRDGSLTDGQIPSLWISEFQRACLGHYYVLSTQKTKSPLERVSVLSAGLYVSMHAFSSAPVNKNNGLLLLLVQWE